MQEPSLKKVTYHHFAYDEHVWRFHESQVTETEGQQFVVLSPPQTVASAGLSQPICPGASILPIPVSSPP